MVDEAKLSAIEGGLEPAGPGWFVVNAREATWWRDDRLGAVCIFEGGDARFEELGINLHVLLPGQPNGMYHRETVQEDFLVLQGECLLLVEGEERRLGPWDFVHCPPGTEHVFVGAGAGPCVILMVGARGRREIHYPASELARRHGASVERPTDDAREAYASFGPLVRGAPRSAGLPWCEGPARGAGSPGPLGPD
jgi:uncharacterized cupin superfamily protein